MADEIINRVANSKLVVIDLETYYPNGKRILLDIKDWLFEGFVLKEKDFRAQLNNHNWSQYSDCFVALTCTSDAIIPGWAYMLITMHLEPFAKKIIIGDIEALETSIYQAIIENIDITEFNNKSIIIKGCSKKPVPENAYIMLSQKIKPVAKSIMYGEACSAVPLFKK
jgi:hypothetical protein